MPRTNVVIRVEVGAADEDRVRHAFNERGVLIVLADGAGGLSGGRRAAETVLAQCGAALSGPADAVEELRRLDAVLDADAGCGQSTAVVVVVHDGQLFGASVGDSGAWLLAPDVVRDLTSNQQRKPLLGSGAAAPVGFGPVALVGRLLVASDGLLKYVPRDRIRQLALSGDIARAADELVAAARLPSGGLQDDLSLALVENADSAPDPSW